jgi:retinol dehydrogenase-12
MGIRYFMLLTQERKALLAHNAKVYVAARSQEKAEVAITELKKSTGKEAHFLKLDLADLKSVKASTEEYLRFVSSAATPQGLLFDAIYSKETTLDVLFNNA